MRRREGGAATSVASPSGHSFPQRRVRVLAQVRIDYEAGDSTYWAGIDDWAGQPPPETSWRQLRVRPPPSDALDEIRCPRALKEFGLVSGSALPVAWEGSEGGDARLQALVPLFSNNGRDANESAWPLVSTHLPGRSGRECRERWLLLQCAVEHAAWLDSPATASVSHVEAAQAMMEANRAAAAKAAAQNASQLEGTEAERCCILGCTTQLLKCSGAKDVGGAVGHAESSHLMCASCLSRWFASQALLREERGLPKQTRRFCPVCQSEVRAMCSEMRSDANKYAMGLLKVAGTWHS